MRIIELTCPNCKGSLEMKISDVTKSAYCPYCGQRFLIDDEKKEYTININRKITDEAAILREVNNDKKDKRDSRQIFIILGVLLIIPVLILSILFFNNSINQSQGKINAGYYKDLIGKDYEVVEAHFEAAGFTNIELVDLDDAGLAFWIEGKVDTITVGGNTSFETIDWFDPSTKVVISYH